MRRAVLLRRAALFLAGVFLLGAPATAQTVEPRVRFDQLAAATFANAKALKEIPLKGATQSYAAQPIPLGDPGATTTVDWLTGALSTNVDGVVAGLSVSPIGLAIQNANPRLAAVNVVVAALEDQQTRLGVKWSSEWVEDMNVAQAAEECLDSADDELAFESKVRELREPFGMVCSTALLLFKDSDLPGDQQLAELKMSAETIEAYWRTARSACGVSEPDAAYRPDNLSPAIEALKKVRTILQRSSSNDVRQRTADVGQAWDKLAEYKFRLRTSACSSSDVTGAWKRALWRAHRVRLGFSAMSDRYALKYGFNAAPADGPLPDGRVSAVNLTSEVSYEHLGWAFRGGVGLKRGREELNGKVFGSILPSFSVSCAAFGIRAKLREEDGDLIVKDGAVPPHVAIGFSASADYATSHPDTQVTNWNAFEVQAFVDFRISDKLSFRLGVPYRGKVVIRKKSDAAPELRDLQRSIPVFVATVIKI